jgi:CubicO group peptidase (beta-lactamase class C family)
MDWAGLVVERATGTPLNDYIQNHICKPLGLENINMFPTDEMTKNLAYMHQRSPAGKLSHRNHLLRRSLTSKTPPQKKAILHSGGGGLFAKPQEYARELSKALASFKLDH